jgi:hypothetical protein
MHGSLCVYVYVCMCVDPQALAVEVRGLKEQLEEARRKAEVCGVAIAESTM